MAVQVVALLLMVQLAQETHQAQAHHKEIMAAWDNLLQTQITAVAVEAALVVRVAIWLLEAQVEQAGLEHLLQLRVQQLQEHGAVLAVDLTIWELPHQEVKEMETVQAQDQIQVVAGTEQPRLGQQRLVVVAAPVS
jgi:hypothetical protein